MTTSIWQKASLAAAWSLCAAAGAAEAPGKETAIQSTSVDVKVGIWQPKLPPEDRTEIVWVRRIWDKRHSGRRWNSWPQVNFFKDMCVVRISECAAGSHGWEQRPVGRLIVSRDGCRSWQSVLGLGDDKTHSGLSHPLTLPDGRFWLESRIQEYAIHKGKYRAMVSDDGLHWSQPKDIQGLRWAQSEAYFMQMAVFKDALYGYHRRTGLMRSADGFKFEEIKTVNFQHKNETAITFLSNGDMLLFSRNGLTGASKPPYTQWYENTTNCQGPHSYGGPRLAATPDGEVYAASRARVSGSGPQFVLWRVEGKQFQIMHAFSGANYYTDLVWHDGFLWMVYSAPPVGGRRQELGETVVYLAKIKPPARKRKLTDLPFPYFFPPSDEEAPQPELIEVKRIADKAPHSSQSDLIRFKSKWFCAFREADSGPGIYRGTKAVGPGNGKLRVLASGDGAAWTLAALLEEDGVDLVAPQLCITSDDRLMLVAGGYVCEPAKPGGKYRKIISDHTHVAFSPDGKTWTKLRKIALDGQGKETRLARVAWHDGKAYAFTRKRVQERRGGKVLVASADGVTYTTVSTYAQHKPVPSPSLARMNTASALIRGFGGSEVAIRFSKGGEMVALTGTWDMDRICEIATSKPPYSHWDVRNVRFNPSGQRMTSPSFVILPSGERWAAGRDGQRKKTMLYRMKADLLEPALALPSAGADRYGGDHGHPGMVLHDGLLWVSYHSGHEAKATGRKAAVYLARIKLPDGAAPGRGRAAPTD